MSTGGIARSRCEAKTNININSQFTGIVPHVLNVSRKIHRSIYEKSKLYLRYGERQANCQTARVTLEPFDHEK